MFVAGAGAGEGTGEGAGEETGAGEGVDARTAGIKSTVEVGDGAGVTVSVVAVVAAVGAAFFVNSPVWGLYV